MLGFSGPELLVLGAIAIVVYAVIRRARMGDSPTARRILVVALAVFAVVAVVWIVLFIRYGAGSIDPAGTLGGG